MGALALALFVASSTCAPDLSELECAATVRQIKLEGALNACLAREAVVRRQLQIAQVLCRPVEAVCLTDAPLPAPDQCGPVELSWAATGLVVLGSMVVGGAAGLAGGLSACP